MRKTLLVILVTLTACGGGGGGGDSAPVTPAPTPAPPAPTNQQPVLSDSEAARFLSQASFGPTDAEIEVVAQNGAESWFRAQLAVSPSLHRDDVFATFPGGNYRDGDGNVLPTAFLAGSHSFWDKAITAPDQLRQRMAFALSQILVVSFDGPVGQFPPMLASYMDVLTSGAFGNYRDLLQAVTYSPAMAVYLTYLRNERGDPVSGRVPDENYARELLQLFTIGLVELNPDGTPVLDASNNPVELFDNNDITGLAKVFTGLSVQGGFFRTPLFFIPAEDLAEPLVMFENFHSPEEKTFLGTTIAAGINGDTSIQIAINAIFEHPNVGPFVGRQLIQRFVTSHPEPAYVARVSAAFDSGEYTLPDGARVGTGERGDLAATLAAVLFDENARDAARAAAADFGRIREPILRFTHWARAFEVANPDTANEFFLFDTRSSELLGQAPYRSPSVFNFYRPGYIAPGTASGDANLTVPELQIANATTVVGYPNILSVYAFELSPKVDTDVASFVPNYSEAIAIAGDTEALLDHLDRLLTHGNLRDETRNRIRDILAMLPDDIAGRSLRARLASILVMTSPEYVVLR